jgi:adenylate cyclase
VFGAPGALAAKEQSAVYAALEIHEEIDRRREESAGEGIAGLRVGVGVATGRAYVGSLRAVDRWIWTALGETTNRAARLQSLTRDLLAAIIIDEATWRALEVKDIGFVAHRSHKLRGLVARHDLFVKPLAPPIPVQPSAMSESTMA